MDGSRGPSVSRYRDHVFGWGRKFMTRREKAYLAEEDGLTQDSNESALTAFLRTQRSRLDPPNHSFPELQNFFEKARDIELIEESSLPQYTIPIALLDDRRDTTGWHDSRGEHFSARDWDGYASYPPQGEKIFEGLLNAGDLYRRLLASRRAMGAERRVIYMADMPPLCGLAIASTCPKLQAPILRDFLQRYVLRRVYFGISMPFGYSMEFHLPYYALRQSDLPTPDPRNLRRYGRFLTKRTVEGVSEFLYEAQISVLVTGTDEWFWTAYCCADTFFGSEETMQFYYNRRIDAPTGGLKSKIYPVWNPREYFLLVLSRRFRQVTTEWANVLNALEGRLQYHEESVFDETRRSASLIDDPQFSLTREYKWTVELIRLLHNSLVKIIESWENFDSTEARCFETTEHSTLRERWDSYLSSIDKDTAELRFFRTSLQQRIEMFDKMKSGLVDTSAMVDGRVNTTRGRMMGRLNVATLPLSLGVALFSMAMVPQNASWVAFIFVTIFLAFLIAAIAYRSELLLHTVQQMERALFDTLLRLI